MRMCEVNKRICIIPVRFCRMYVIFKIFYLFSVGIIFFRFPYHNQCLIMLNSYKSKHFELSQQGLILCLTLLVTNFPNLIIVGIFVPIYHSYYWCAADNCRVIKGQSECFLECPTHCSS